MEIKDYNNFNNYPNQYLTKLSEVNSIQIVIILSDQSTFYSITKLDIFNELKESFIFSFNNRYSVNVFYGIMLDIRAAGISIVREPQV